MLVNCEAMLTKVEWLLEGFVRCGGGIFGPKGDNDLFVGGNYAVRCCQELEDCVEVAIGAFFLDASGEGIVVVRRFLSWVGLG